MKAVILAAGQGTRMGPLTGNIPKVMLPIANKPILMHVIRSALDAGINEFVIVTGYGEKIIKDYFKDGSSFNTRIKYVHQEKQLGTADAIGCAKGMVGDRFLVLNGDIIVNPAHIRKLVECRSDIVLTARHVDNPSEYGVFKVEKDRVLRIIEKPSEPPTDLANAGIYVFNSSIFDAIGKTPLSVRKEYEITDSLQMLIDEGMDIRYVTLSDKWMDIGKPWELLDASEYFLSDLVPDIRGEIEPYATLKGSVSVGEGTIIRNGSYIEGPVIIGKNCDIGPNCYIRPGTCLGDNVRIGNAVEIKNSIIMNATHIGHLSYVGDSIIGERCNFGAGTKVANLRHDGRSILVKLKGKMVDSGRRKLGTIMGDDVHTGINSMINVGAVIEAKTLITPGEFVT